MDGVRRTASMLLLEDAQVGDWVIVHAGFAIQQLDEEGALETIRLLKETVSMIEEKQKSK